MSIETPTPYDNAPVQETSPVPIGAVIRIVSISVLAVAILAFSALYVLGGYEVKNSNRIEIDK